ncbi:hypothetical protein ACQP3J_31020, partial [Escherichia coli]
MGIAKAKQLILTPDTQCLQNQTTDPAVSKTACLQEAANFLILLLTPLSSYFLSLTTSSPSLK